MSARDILLLGHPDLLRPASPVRHEEIPELEPVAQDMLDTLRAFRRRYGAGRAIAAPQIGVLKRLVVMEIDEPRTLYNPALSEFGSDQIELWDDCMSFPDLLVRVRRHRTCRLSYRDAGWTPHRETLDGALSELLQHECDHLDGILAVSRAVDAGAFCLRSEAHRLDDRYDLVAVPPA